MNEEARKRRLSQLEVKLLDALNEFEEIADEIAEVTHTKRIDTSKFMIDCLRLIFRSREHRGGE